MKTLENFALIKAFPPTKSTIGLRFQRSNGWLTNGFFAIKEQLEPKYSQAYRFKETEVDIIGLINKTNAKLESKDPVYEVASIANCLELSFGSEFLLKLESEHFTAWVNPRYLTYLLKGVAFIRDYKIMISNSFDPVLLVDKDKEILGLVMPFRRDE